MRLPSKYNSFFANSLSLVSPAKCPICARPAGKHALAILCPGCRPKYEHRFYCQCCGHWLPNLRWLQEYSIQHCRACQKREIHFLKARAVRPYIGIWKKAVLHYKLTAAPELCTQFASLCCRLIRRGQLSGRYQGISSIPKRKNSPSAAEQLAIALAKRLPGAYIPALKFKHKTLAQHTLRRQQRLSNMKNSMQIEKKKSIQGCWLLVDDIYTTGATVNEGARVLREAGAELVEVITLARGLDRRVRLD